MLTLEQLQKEWESDSPIDTSNLSAESARIPILHAKYMAFYTQYRQVMRKKENIFLELKRNKERYYRGEMDRAELQKLGWPQYQGVKPIKSELQNMLETDPDMMRASDVVFAFELAVDFLKEVIKQINNRSFAIRDAIDWTKFTNGLN